MRRHKIVEPIGRRFQKISERISGYIPSVCGSIRQFSFRIGFLEWSRYTLHRPSRIGFLRDAVALTRVTTAGQADSELEEGELR
jgi:hypothetical protein